VRTIKGWVLVENNKLVITSNNSVDVFRTKSDLLDYYGGALGDLNSIIRVELRVVEEAGNGKCGYEKEEEQ
jgi:hypothetical protein